MSVDLQEDDWPRGDPLVQAENNGPVAVHAYDMRTVQGRQFVKKKRSFIRVRWVQYMRGPLDLMQNGKGIYFRE